MNELCELGIVVTEKEYIVSSGDITALLRVGKQVKWMVVEDKNSNNVWFDSNITSPVILKKLKHYMLSTKVLVAMYCMYNPFIECVDLSAVAIEFDIEVIKYYENFTIALGVKRVNKFDGRIWSSILNQDGISLSTLTEVTEWLCNIGLIDVVVYNGIFAGDICNISLDVYEIDVKSFDRHSKTNHLRNKLADLGVYLGIKQSHRAWKYLAISLSSIPYIVGGYRPRYIAKDLGVARKVELEKKEVAAKLCQFIDQVLNAPELPSEVDPLEIGTLEEVCWL